MAIDSLTFLETRRSLFQKQIWPDLSDLLLKKSSTCISKRQAIEIHDVAASPDSGRNPTNLYLVGDSDIVSDLSGERPVPRR